MKISIVLRAVVLSLLTLLVIQLDAQEIEIGKSWEFNEDGNFEGITLSPNLSDAVVENGYKILTI